MNPATINVAEVIGTPNAIIQKFGLELLDRVKSEVAKGNRVVVDFEGLRNITTGFLHASIGNLARQVNDFELLVSTKGLEGRPDWQEKYFSSIRLAKGQSASEEVDKAIAELFQD